MRNYKVVFRADLIGAGENEKVTWEPGCPLMFDVFQVSRDTETGEAYLQSRVRNLCPDVVRSFTATFVSKYSDGSTERITINPLDADVAGGDTYEVSPQRLCRGDVTFVDATVGSVQVESREWVSATGPQELPSKTSLDLADELLGERAKQLKENGCTHSSEAASYSVEKHGSWTLCACGQPVVGLIDCPRCKLNLTADIAENAERLAADLDTRTQREAERRKFVMEKRQRDGKIALVVGAAAFAVLLLWLIFVVAPQQAASSALDKLGDYNDAQPDEIQQVIDEHYRNMSEDDKLDALELLGITKAIEASKRKYSRNGSEADYFDDMTEVSDEGDGTYRVRTYIREDTKDNGFFYWTNDVYFTINIEEPTVKLSEIDIVDLGLIGFNGI